MDLGVASRTLALCLTVATAAGPAGCASRAATASTAVPPSRWSVVEALPPGSEIVVERRGGDVVSGKTRAVTSTSIEVGTGEGVRSVPRLDVMRVLRTRSRAGIGAARGAAIGGAIGVLQALLLTKSDRLTFAGIFSAVWAPVGAILGAVEGARHRHTSVVYSVQ